MPDDRGMLGGNLRRKKRQSQETALQRTRRRSNKSTPTRKDKKNGVFHFDDGSKKERRREDYKSLIGNHLISACAAGDLFSAFNNVAVKMETLRQMTENVENGGRRRTG